MAKTIKTLNPNPSKAEEIDFIWEVCNSLPADSYLARILKDVKEYAATEIKNDHGVGLFEVIRAREAEIAGLNRAMSLQSDEIVEAKETNQKLFRSREDMIEKVANLTASIQQFEDNEVQNHIEIRRLTAELALLKAQQAHAKCVEAAVQAEKDLEIAMDTASRAGVL